MGVARTPALAALACFLAFGAAPLAGSPPAAAAPPCPALDDVEEKIGDMQFDLENLRLVMNNAYASIDVKKHDEDFRLKTMINAFGYLGRAVAAAGDPGLSQQFEAVTPDYEHMRDAVEGQFVVVQDDHDDFFSGVRYQSPRLAGTGADPDAYAAIDALEGGLRDLSAALDPLREQGGCPAPGEGGAGADDESGAPDEDEPQCRFHPGSNQCDATGSILH
ncbi:hypothetical protein Srot_0419 [Segniliparus rotundus DSM 44985]|uniref:Uncharacterized protein n=1 Tax=Segniliparus rotundus (strain ATCC BAA-972 / CDC 1076 / CIP 108378 / DSM 44985 / JCM 13578) TaxID=640132 RepID=D6ZBS9_SEGRD|nr:hypothetical protein [Segniliparus rotundus]ADG96906.1 hypothetical protein Srot_0419 [Segniliparus rotundus DSM 44985]